MPGGQTFIWHRKQRCQLEAAYRSAQSKPNQKLFVQASQAHLSCGSDFVLARWPIQSRSQVVAYKILRTHHHIWVVTQNIGRR